MIMNGILLRRNQSTNNVVVVTILVVSRFLFNNLYHAFYEWPRPQIEWSLPTKEKKHIKDIPVFYNVYLASQHDHDRVQHIIMDQLSHLKYYHHPVYVHTIGHPLSIPNTTLLQHHDDALEIVTLNSLWEYCQSHPSTQVVYLHSKGSYHPSNENDRMRQLLTIAALSDECANNTDNVVSNVCGYRISPFPHPHVPGNMWLAHCSYVNNLLKPTVFEKSMNQVYERLVLKHFARNYHCVGNGRYAAEHWILSHPSCKPSDLYTNQNFTSGYHGLKETYQQGDYEWKVAPRYDLDHWSPGCQHTDLTHRLKEYRWLYNMTPEKDWWGWNFWLGSAQNPHRPT
jgi:hypothetical protein